MSQVFVMLSGYSYGLAYQQILIRDGYRQVFAKSFYRSFTIYSYHCIVVMLLLFFFLAPFAEYKKNPFLMHGMDRMIDQPTSYIIEMLSLTNFPEIISILPLYVILLAVAPFLIIAYEKNRLLAITLSASAYCYSQAYHLSILTDFTNIYIPFSKNNFNPLAWQFLFFIAMTLGVKRISNQRIEFGAIAKYFSMAFLVIVFMTYKIIRPLLNRGYINLDVQWLTEPFDKTFLTPAILIHALCLWLLFVMISPKSEVYGKSALVKAFILCGKNSIEVYALGMILAFSSYYFFHELDGGLVSLITIEIIAIALSLSLIPLKTIYLKGT